jgi:TonB-dependent starch-binding outer membrane protein SusC
MTQKHKLPVRVCIILFCTLFFGFSALAQKKVSGTVTNDKGEVLEGATITVKNTSTHVTTNSLGVFTIDVPAQGKTLLVSYVGMQTQEIAIGKNETFKVALNPFANTLNDVVVIGYGTARRANVSSSISSISEKDIKNLPAAGADQLLQGKVSGVTISSNGGQPGGGVSVQVRGITSVNGNEPLYVIDGVPVASTNTSLEQNVLGGGSGQTSQSGLALINPADIASIDILKDASAQAIYGSRAANGVVLITTKKGKTGQGKLGYDFYYGWQRIPKKLDVMDLQQFAQYQNSLVPEIRAVGLGADTVGEFKNPAVLGKGTDWQDEIYRTGNIQSHQLSFSGGSDKTTYYFSGGYYDQAGILIGTKFTRYSMRFSIDQQVKTWLRAGINGNLSRSNQKIGLSDAFDAVTSVVLYNSPAAMARDVYGNFVNSTNLQGQSVGQSANPVAQATLRDVGVVTSKAFGNIYAELTLAKGLRVRNEFNYDFSLASKKAFQPFVQNPVSNEIVMSPSKLSEERNSSFYWALKNYINYDNTFGKHAVSATAGHEAQESQWDYIQAYRDGLQQNLPSLAVGSTANQTIGAGAGPWSMESYFGRIRYTFDNKYSIEGIARADGSSSFGPGKRWGRFYAGSASWTITNEEFAKHIRGLDYLKLRVGAGSVGNQNTGGVNLYSTNIDLARQSPWGTVGFPANLGNVNLGWESVVTYNAGVDATLFNHFAEVSVDVYKKVTKNMLLPAQLPVFSGLSADGWLNILVPTSNAGQMTNTGIDIGITTYNINRKNFTWKTNLTFSHYKNRLDRLNDSSTAIFGTFDEYGTAKTVSVTKAGNPVGSFYGFVTDGLFRTEAELASGINYGNVSPTGVWLGDIRFKDVNGNKIIDDQDVTVIGSPHPKFTAGLTNTVSWKSLDLSVFLYGSYGAKIFNYTRIFTEGLNSPWNNQLATVLNRYTAENPNGVLPRYTGTGVQQGNLRVSDRYVENGSFLRIQNISLGYNIPKEILAKAKISSFRVFVSAQNLHTFTKYSGYDPEIGAINNKVGLMNIDNGHFPNPRTFTVGANVEF